MKKLLLKVAKEVFAYFSCPIMYDSEEGREIYIPPFLT